MYIALSAASLDKYEWYRYRGTRPIRFLKHNKHHDLVIENKDRFGIRKYGSSYKLIDLTEPNIIFSLNEKEVARILSKSVGTSPKVKGRNLPKGDTVFARKTVPIKKRPKKAIEKEVPKENRVHVKKEDVLNKSLYPNVSMPPKKADIQRLYTLMNKKYFDDECPKKVKFILSRAIKFLGRASVKLSADRLEYGLSLAQKTLTDVKTVVNVVLHEMIHLHHYVQAYEYGDGSYINAQHGPLFIRDMNRLNSLGYEIEIRQVDTPSSVELAEQAYVLMVQYADGDWRFAYGYKPFKSTIEDIIARIKSVTHHTVEFKRYIYGTTKNSHAYIGTQLTNKLQLPAHSKRFYILNNSDSIIQGLLNDMKIIEEKSLKIDVSGDVRAKLVRRVEQHLVYKEMSWSTYVSNIVFTFLGQEDPIKDSLTEQEIRKHITEAEYDFIRSNWMDVKDMIFIKGGIKKELRKAILQNDVDGREAINYILRIYKNSFKDRFETDRVASLIIDMYGDLLTMGNDEIIDAVNDMWKSNGEVSPR